MWNSSTTMSGSPFCRRAAAIAPSRAECRCFVVLGTGIGGFRENAGVSVFNTRLRAPRARTR